jgi:sulfoxide reductase heme-binding subunit YedZ
MAVVNKSRAVKYRSYIKVFVFLFALLPLLQLFLGVMQNSLGPDPAKALAHLSGEWALRFLIITMAITPLRIVTRSSEWVHYRRMMGLFVFFYAVLHLLIYCVFLLGLQWQDLWADILERPYITVGFGAWVLLLPLAVTSTKRWQRKLGRQWSRLHKLIYMASALILLHIIWQARSDLAEPLVYVLIFSVLMLLRLPIVKRIFNDRAKKSAAHQH